MRNILALLVFTIMCSCLSSVSSGSCCCSYSFAGRELSYSTQCGSYGNHGNAFTIKSYFDGNCNGDHEEESITVSSCDLYNEHRRTVKENCRPPLNSVSSTECVWNESKINSISFYVMMMFATSVFAI